jgi:hypothetical protein
MRFARSGYPSEYGRLLKLNPHWSTIYLGESVHTARLSINVI